FKEQPPTLTAFFETHRNPGVLAIVTLTERGKQPVFFTTVHTCGCFRALLPTDLLSAQALPDKWPRDTKRVSGKTLPAIVKHPQLPRSRIVLWLQPKTHRVERIETLCALP